jgi:hypothetical protein
MQPLRKLERRRIRKRRTSSKKKLCRSQVWPFQRFRIITIRFLLLVQNPLSLTVSILASISTTVVTISRLKRAKGGHSLCGTQYNCEAKQNQKLIFVVFM